MREASAHGLGALLLIAACVAKPVSQDSSGSAATSDGNSTAVTTSGALTVDGATSTTSTTGTSTISTTTTTDTTGGPPLICPPAPCTKDTDCPDGLTCIDPAEDFDLEYSALRYCFPPADSNTGLCDIYAQDCPSGFKCVHQIFDGTEPGCAPLQDDASPPDTACEKLPACRVDEYGNGIYPDTCDLGSQCVAGTCRQFCTPDYECPAGYECNSGRVSLWCIKTCDPLVKECGPDKICYPDFDAFFCAGPIPDTFPEPGPLFEPCDGWWGCADGLACVDKSAAVECQELDVGCCVPYCDLEAPLGALNCPGEGQGCVPWPWQFDPKPEYAHLGYCGVPQ